MKKYRFAFLSPFLVQYLHAFLIDDTWKFKSWPHFSQWIVSNCLLNQMSWHFYYFFIVGSSFNRRSLKPDSTYLSANFDCIPLRRILSCSLRCIYQKERSNFNREWYAVVFSIEVSPNIKTLDWVCWV